MTTYAYGARGGSSPLGVGNQPALNIEVYEFDTAKALAGTLGSGGTGMVTTDLMKIQIIPAGTILMYIQATIETALSWGASNRLDIGDSAAATTFVSNYTTTTTGAVTMAATSKYYDAADYITVKMTGATLATGIVRVIMVLASAVPNAPTTFIGNIT